MKTAKIGIDLDGIIINHTENTLKTAGSFGFALKKEQTVYQIMKGLIPQEERRKISKIVYGKLSLSPPPWTYALSSMKKLHRKGLELFILSARQQSHYALKWLKKYGVTKDVPLKNIFFVKESEDKAAIVRKIKVDIFLDDKTTVLESIQKYCLPVWFNPHKLKNALEFKEVHSWLEFVKLSERTKK
ncbi:MAG: hypothetical protein PHW31_03455 [Candidatus Pacebacteria bacterium]|nr:hypothetical protein [Candidatus Paceibacterota bacterium]